MSHIRYSYYEYGEDYYMCSDDEGQPMYMTQQVGVDQAYCGAEDHAGILYFAADPAEADCQDCIDAFALGTLADLP